MSITTIQYTPETLDSEYCSGFRHCHRSKKVYDQNDQKCRECRKDAENALTEEITIE